MTVPIWKFSGYTGPFEMTKTPDDRQTATMTRDQWTAIAHLAWQEILHAQRTLADGGSPTEVAAARKRERLWSAIYGAIPES
jgi:hypothetical protein